MFLFFSNRGITIACLSGLQEQLKSSEQQINLLRDEISHRIHLRDDVIPKLETELAAIKRNIARTQSYQQEEIVEFQRRHERTRIEFQAKCDERAGVTLAHAADHAIKRLDPKFKVCICVTLGPEHQFNKMTQEMHAIDVIVASFFCHRPSTTTMHGSLLKCASTRWSMSDWKSSVRPSRVITCN